MSGVRPPPAPDLPQLPRSPSLHAVLATPVDRTGACRLLPCPRGLPRLTGGSASTTSLSRPAQASLALRPAGLLARPKAALIVAIFNQCIRRGLRTVYVILRTATGDLKGGLGVTVLSLSLGPGGTVLFHNHHHWVTEAGDTIFSMMRTPSHIQRAIRVCMQPATRTASRSPVEPDASRERRERSPRSAPSI